MDNTAVPSRGYMVVASCDPYNARFHYNGQKVLKYDGATPVEWVFDDGYGRGLTLHEALNALERIASLTETLSFYEDSSFEDGEIPSWFKGAGYYMDGYDYYLLGDRSFDYDTMYYSIEPML